MVATAVQSQEVEGSAEHGEEQLVVFTLSSEAYGVDIGTVREIIRMQDITRVPRTPECVEGVINLRGQVIPVVDLRAKFGMDTAEVTEETCVIVVEITQNDRQISTGLVVDRVSEVLDISADNIEESPNFGSSVNTDFILGMAKVESTVKTLLDIDKVLSSTDVAGIATVSAVDETETEAN